MKPILLFVPLLFVSVLSPAQTDLHIKTDPVELILLFPRLNIGLERKFINSSYWGSVHYGWDGLGLNNFRNYLPGEYYFWGLSGGIKKVLTDRGIEQFVGAHLRFDKTRVPLDDDVFYHIDQEQAVLYDKANYRRTRIGLFIDYGHFIADGNHFSFEASHSLGVRLIDKSYSDIENPFLLNEVDPFDDRYDLDYKFVEKGLKVAYVFCLKLGWRL